MQEKLITQESAKDRKQTRSVLKNKKKSHKGTLVLSRVNKIEKTQFPETGKDGKNILYVYTNKEGLGFKFNQYDPDICQNNISEKEFKDVVYESTKICEKVWMKQKMQEVSDYNASLKKYLYAAIGFSIIAFILLLILIYGVCNNYDVIRNKEGVATERIYEECDNKSLLWVAISFLIIAGGLTVMVVITGLIENPVFIDLEKTMKEDLEVYLNKKNQENSRVKWEVSEDVLYLSCTLQN